MAINTSGFQVRNMPQFVAPNPSLVAFTPQPIASGMGDVFRLAQQYEALKASKALQAEQAATRAKRVEAENARNLAAIQLLPPDTQAKLATLAANQPNIPLQGQLTGQKLQYDLGTIGAALKRQPSEEETKDVLTRIAGETAKFQGEELPRVLSLQSAKTGIDLSDAMAREYYAPDMAMDAARINAATAADAAANLEGDLMLKRQMAEAKLATEKAQAKHLLTQGNNIIPPGVTYARAVEQVAGKLHITPEQVQKLAGTRTGLSILSKLDSAQKSQFGTQPRFTKEEEAMIAEVVGPVPGAAVPSPAPAQPPPSQKKQAPAPAPAGNKIRFKTDADGNIVPVTK